MTGVSLLSAQCCIYFYRGCSLYYFDYHAIDHFKFRIRTMILCDKNNDSVTLTISFIYPTMDRPRTYLRLEHKTVLINLDGTQQF